MAIGTRLRVASALVGLLVLVAGCAKLVGGTAEPAVGVSIAPTTTPKGSFLVPTESSQGDDSVVPLTTPSTDPAIPSSSSRSAASSSQSSDPNTPQAMDVDGSTGTILIGAADAKVTIDLLAEPLCPPCAAFETTYGPEIKTAVDAGSLRVRLHLMTFLDPKSASGDYSTRADQVLACGASAAIPDQADAFLAFFGRVFDPDKQPAEGGTSDLTTAQIAALSTPDGFPDLTKCAVSSEAKGFITKSEAEGERLLSAAGASGTPAVIAKNKAVSTDDPNWLRTLVG